jgi:hypothetical protein
MTTYAGTREFAQKCLEGGYRLSHSAWTFWSNGWTCNGGCCNDEGLSVEEVLDALDGFCNSKYEEVRVEAKP